MSDLEPLSETSDSSHVRELLTAGRNDCAPPDFAQRLLVGLGVASVGATVVGTTAAAVQGAVAGGSKVVSSSLALVAAKWVAVGVVGGAILAGGAELAFPPPKAATSAPAARAPRAAGPIVKERPAPGVPGAAVATAQASEAAASSANPPSSKLAEATNATPSVSPLGREVQAIDRVRRALASGQAARALEELDLYERITSTHVLDREARVLRIQALYLAGEAARAQQLADAYLRELPNDAHAARLRALRDAH